MLTKQMDTEVLNQRVCEIANEFGYETAMVSFSKFADFKVRWTRSYKFIDFQMSDYLLDCPVDAFLSLVEHLFRKIQGEGDCTYSDEFKQYVKSDAFFDANFDKFISRHRARHSTTAERDALKGHIREDMSLLVTKKEAPFYSVLFKTAVVPASFFDTMNECEKTLCIEKLDRIAQEFPLYYSMYD